MAIIDRRAGLLFLPPASLQAAAKSRHRATIRVALLV